MRISDWSSDVCSSDLERRRYANLKPSGSSPTGHPAIDCLDHSLTQIRRKSSCHEGWPPSPALTVNHKSMPKGIHSDSTTSQNDLATTKGSTRVFNGTLLGTVNKGGTLIAIFRVPK